MKMSPPLAIVAYVLLAMILFFHLALPLITGLTPDWHDEVYQRLEVLEQEAKP